MSLDIKVPVLPESVTEATVAAWHKKPGEFVARDESLVDIETDKVVLEVVAPEDGVLEKIIKDTGATVQANEVIATFAAKSMPASQSEVQVATTATTQPTAPTPQSSPVTSVQTVAPVKQSETPASQSTQSVVTAPVSSNVVLSPSARRAVNEGTMAMPEANNVSKPINTSLGNRIEKRVPMTRLRARIAERLLQAQQNAAILTTFNEINMQPVIELRSKYREEFEEKYGVRLGFMSFFVTAVVAALKRFPAVNASIDGNDIVYHGYFDIGIAVSTPRGLVVPILRDADTLSMAEIEKKIKEFSAQAQDGKIAIEDITGGTFTITNGGVFGSLMATPILNPPQSGILGMHKIEERPVVENKQVVIRPMMYVALSYDHRIIDGAESVQFLVTIKELLEEPARLLLSV
jgi:2-oxoglutarate dehydrogenase E2 component (dihydrolipoamide succinyltransferase)